MAVCIQDTILPMCINNKRVNGIYSMTLMYPQLPYKSQVTLSICYSTNKYFLTDMNDNISISLYKYNNSK